MKKYFLIVQAICCIFLISCQNKIVLDDKIFTANEVAMICPVADFYLKGYLAEKQIEIEEEIIEIKFISGQNTGQSKPNLKVLIDDKEIATTKQVRHGLELNLQDIQLYESKTMQVIDINRPSCLIEKSIIRKCSPSKIYNQLQNKCNDCPERQSKMNDFECGCSDQYADINDYCWCSDPYIWQNGQCVACGDKQKKINNQTCACILEGAQFPICDCPGDLVEIDNRCDCPMGQIKIGNNCNCPGNQIKKGNECGCPGNQHEIVDNNCVCKIKGAIYPDCNMCMGDLTIINDKCDCPIGQVKSGNNCNCPGNQIKKGNECGCPGNDHKIAGGMCVCKIEGALYPACNLCLGDLIIVDNKCDCPSGHIREGNTCSCPDNKVFFDNKCDICKGIYDEIEKACKPCPSGTTYYEHPINECIQSCDEPDLNNSACLGFHDSFERINISGAPFNWTYKVEDNGASGDQCYFEIRNTTEMGYGLENGGNKIAVARGRTGGSTHEMYLISRSFDFSDWNKVLIKFYYFPINLDLSAIWFNNLGLYQHEHVRIDICKSSDDACGLTDFKVEKIRSRSSWQALWINEKQGPYTNTERGSGLDLVPGQKNFSPPWQIAEFTIDLSDPVFATRKNNFVFKITAAMDEGCRESLNCSKAVYSSVKKNTRYSDDVILIDEVIVIGFK